MPHLQLATCYPYDHLWMSHGGQIDRYPRSDFFTHIQPSKKRQRHSSITLTSQIQNDDFCRFVAYPRPNDPESTLIAAGTRSGLLYFFHQPSTSASSDPENFDSVHFRAHQGDLHCVDLILDHGLAVTGSRDRTVKIWKMDGEMKSMLDFGDRIWCVKANNRHRPQLVAVGSAACFGCAPVTLWDIER